MNQPHTNTKSTSKASSLPGWLAVSLAVVITLIGGALYGGYSQRWGPPADLVAAGAHLSEMPPQIGPWTLVEELPMGKTAIEMLECAGYVNRRYIHQDSGRSISVTVIVGPPGPIAVHTPEICFSSRAYDIQDQRKQVVVKAAGRRDNSFWRVEFKTRNPFAERLRVYYAWSRGEQWVASDSPRYAYAAAPLLYKIQLATPVAPGTDDDGSDPGRQFLEDLSKTKWSLVPNKGAELNGR